jgi:integrase
MTRQGVGKFLREAGKLMGTVKEPIQISPHSLRKFFGRILYYENNVDLAMLQTIFNHSNQKITMIYLDIQQDQIEEKLLNIAI